MLTVVESVAGAVARDRVLTACHITTLANDGSGRFKWPRPNRRPFAFRITDHRAGPAVMVYVPAQRPAVYGDERRCTWMYEARNETAQIDPPAGRVAWP